MAVIPAGPEAGWVAATTYGGGTVALIIPNGSVVAYTVTVGHSPLGVAVSPTGGDIYVANLASNNVSVISVPLNGSPSVTASIPVGKVPPGRGHRHWSSGSAQTALRR